MKAVLPFSGKVNIPFDAIRDNPELIVQKLPRVATIVRHGPLDFHVTLNAYEFHAGLHVQATGHIKLEVSENQIVWARSEHEAGTNCNGCIEGTATRDTDGYTLITGDIEMTHYLLNSLTWAYMKPWISRIADSFVLEFVQNFYNDQFSNELPTGA